MLSTIKHFIFIVLKQYKKGTEVIMHKVYYVKFLAFLMLAATVCPAHAYKVKTFEPLRVNPLAVPYSAYQQPGANESYPKITQLEFTLFKKTYERENIYNRLTRLENKLFRRNFNNMPLASRVDNILANIDPGIIYNISSRELAKLESKVLGRTYMNDDTESRITRLEKEMLGAMQGGNLTERFNTIKTASKHYNSYPELAQSQSVYPMPATYGMNNNWSGTRVNRGVGGLLQNVLGAIFGDFSTTGTMSGFTPPIYDPYNPYGAFTNPGMGQQNYYMGNHGGYIDNRNIGSGSSVRILD